MPFNKLSFSESVHFSLAGIGRSIDWTTHESHHQPCLELVLCRMIHANGPLATCQVDRPVQFSLAICFVDLAWSHLRFRLILSYRGQNQSGAMLASQNVSHECLCE